MCALLEKKYILLLIKYLKLIISIITAILRCKFIKFDKFKEHFCAKNMHLQGTYIQGSGYIKLPLSDSILVRVWCKF